MGVSLKATFPIFIFFYFLFFVSLIFAIHFEIQLRLNVIMVFVWSTENHLKYINNSFQLFKSTQIVEMFDFHIYFLHSTVRRCHFRHPSYTECGVCQPNQCQFAYTIK